MPATTVGRSWRPARRRPASSRPARTDNPRRADPLDPLTDLRPATAVDLANWVLIHTGVAIAAVPVCRGHAAPLDIFAAQWFDRPPITLTIGPRGGGKSLLAALNTHVRSRWNPRHGTRILGGSKAQSQQIQHGLRDFVWDAAGTMRTDAPAIAQFMKESVSYVNGSEVMILAASDFSVRGPHVPSLKLDEVDEIASETREAAMGMCMARHGYAAAVDMTSTWHNLNGPMATLIDTAKGGAFPLYSYCVFDVLERCPASRSGPYVGGPDLYLHCPACPIQPWCHAGRADYPDGDPLGPKAKRSAGHYAIDSLIQKVHATSPRVFEADYLCLGPRADGLWFPQFDPATHVTPDAEYDPQLPVHLAVDSGVWTGAVWFQVARGGPPGTERVRVFADYLDGPGVNGPDQRTAESNARAILEVARVRCNGRIDRGTTDPAGKSRNAIGPTVLAEYARSGLRLDPWPKERVADGLALIESFVRDAAGTAGLTVHPRCGHLIDAFRSYRRKKVRNQWLDEPMDEDHPAEDLLDPLRCGLVAVFPNGRVPPPRFGRTPAHRFL